MAQSAVDRGFGHGFSDWLPDNTKQDLWIGSRTAQSGSRQDSHPESLVFLGLPAVHPCPKGPHGGSGKRRFFSVVFSDEHGQSIRETIPAVSELESWECGPRYSFFIFFRCSPDVGGFRQ